MSTTQSEIETFLAERTRKVAGARIDRRALYDAFTDWPRRTRKPSLRSFNFVLAQNEFVPEDTSTERVWKGVELIHG